MQDMDTIAAISTPLGEGGLAIIRVSGPEAISQVSELFAAKDKLTNVPTHTVHYGFIRNPLNGERLEEVLVTVMKAPRSFTMEDVVEVSCHGGMISVKKVLQLLLQPGIVRLADPGEFTKRAFLNGRIDLSQAEAVIDLIRSKSDRAFSIALKQVDGTLSKRIRSLRHRLVELIAHIEVNIDYPEHDVEELTNYFIKNKCKEALEEIDILLKTAEQGKILREGLTTAIVGRPNVGKSSLLNVLAQENRAIVTEIPGTTRDVIEEYVSVGGIPLRLLDTAGIRETNDIVERLGVERSRQTLEEADLLLVVLSLNDELHEDERLLLEQLLDKQVIIIVNKMDLSVRLEVKELHRYVTEDRIVYMSMTEDRGLHDLEKAITTVFFGGQLDSGDLTYVSNVRHIQLLHQAHSCLLEALEGTDSFTPIDLLQIDIRNAWELLGEIIGDAVGESLVEQIFAQFCLGK